MAHAASTETESSNYIGWMWQSDPNLEGMDKSQSAEWKRYSDVESLIIKEVFSKNQPKVILAGYYIDFKNNVQISYDDNTKQRLVKREVRKSDDILLREERFMETPITSQHVDSGQYGWISRFVVEVKRDLNLKKDQLPSKDKGLLSMLVKKAACGIVEEGKQIGKQREAEKLADLLREQKDKEMANVWKCCAHLYSFESFLYKNLNATMRLIGNVESEHVWRSKIRTLGPFCLLLWDDPLNKSMKITPKQLAFYIDMAKDPTRYSSSGFQAFTSCSRTRQIAERFGNTLLIVHIMFAFTADISSLSQFPAEEEELITPGVSFSVKSVNFDPEIKKHVITLKLRQRWCGEHKQRFSNYFYAIISFFLRNIVRKRSTV